MWSANTMISTIVLSFENGGWKSKIPTLSLKKISISPKATVFILLGIGIIFISLLFYTFETLLIFGVVYLISIPISFFMYKKRSRKEALENAEDEHEDVL